MQKLTLKAKQMKKETFETEIVKLLKNNDTIKQVEIKKAMFEKGIKIDFRTIRLSVERIRRKWQIEKKGVRLYVVSGDFGYSLQPINAPLTKHFLAIQSAKIKTMQETLETFFVKSKKYFIFEITFGLVIGAVKIREV